MTSERIRIDLERRGDDWSADVRSVDAPELAAGESPGGGWPSSSGERISGHAAGESPGGILEQIGQKLDAREAQRLSRARGVGGA